MNKKNFPIFISVFIVSLFFTVVFYFAKVNLDANYMQTRASNFADAHIDDHLSEEDLKKIREIDGVKEAGRFNINFTSAQFGDDLIVIYRQDNHINKMREFSFTEEGRFPENPEEIMLSKSLVEKHKLKIGDEIPISFGKRYLDKEELDPANSRLEKETFDKTEEKSYKLVGIYEDIYNKYAGLSYGLIYDTTKDAQPVVLRFDDFVDAHLNKKIFEDEISKRLGRKIEIKFFEPIEKYYWVNDTWLEKIMAKAVMIFTLVLMIGIFIFFIRNIFWVWGLRKIKELSIYKSIGSTNFQIYKFQFKEASLISMMPILLGHLFGFALIYGLYDFSQKNLQISKFEYVRFSPFLTILILFVSFLVVSLSIIKPARKISKINIIDGIRENIDLSRSKKKKNDDLWKELRNNNLSSIKSQRYISAIGILIISMFILTISISKYFRDYYDYDSSYNILTTYYSSDKKVPDVLRNIEKEIPCKKSFIYKDKYIAVKNNLELADEAKIYKIDEKIKENLKEKSQEYLQGSLIGLDIKDLEKLGGKKGEFILYNKVQADPLEPIDTAQMVKYFKNPDNIDISMVDFEKKIKISKQIYDTGEFEIKPFPFVVNIFTDYETYFKLIEEAKDKNYLNYPYTLKMKIEDKELSSAKEFIENKLRESLKINERYYVFVGKEIAEQEASSLKYLLYISLAIGIIIFILNVTNGYSSINISLISRKKEIGSLYSAGMDADELKRKYEKEFFLEQVKSFILVTFISLTVMIIISILSPKLSLFILLKYYDYKMYFGFALVVYAINLLIYHLSLKRILDRPTIDLIRTE
ncbi:ABC transporter permease [Anaerococcus lactolyticus]|uniref:ABC transporter permease n=1 Tax=Anaerococcus lactolyticus S7-1-13 TaxID=1284686 RepID=A0A095X011_9FIRM|nr:FtsX-like permease family protein [Anaerococcus lactolyticus]KGF03056.1 ABC transporter permease [Anaerococcus lactolyticus S7-1-13]